jgi:hypothetical protein
VDPLLLSAREAAAYLGVSKSYFEESVRPYLSVVDMKDPKAKKPMPRWSRSDLEAFASSRRRERKSA